jgi:hypothetical protein
MVGSKTALKVAINMVANNQSIVDHIAQRAYENETQKGFDKLLPEQRVLWVSRARSMIQALSETIA